MNMQNFNPGNWQGKTVLIVDDEAELREILANEFADHGAEVIVASDGTEAFQKTAQKHVDLILSDIRMPG